MTAQELINSILQYAIQGKLVPQNPNDEPAIILKKRIQAEKLQCIKEKKIKAEKPLQPITEDEIPFEIPDSWVWVRLGEIFEINPRNKIDDTLDVSFIPMSLISQGYLSNHTYELKKWGEIKSGFTHFAENDIAIAKITPCFENRKSAILKNLINGHGAGTTELHILRPILNTIDLNYLLFFCKTDYFIKGGVKSFTGTAGQQRISKDYVSNCLFPLPPLSEQHSIVEKFLELMTLTEEYDKAEKKLKQLNNAFPEQFKKSILQYAVQGKLVPQNLHDEFGSELLKKIEAEKEQLISERKVKRVRQLLPISDEEKPFEIPESWEWARLYDVSIIQEGAGIRSFQYKSSGIQILTVTNILEGSVDLKKSKKYVSNEEYLTKYTHLKVDIGDIVSSCSGASWGKTAIFDETETVMLNTSTLRLRFYNDSANNKYLYYVTKSPLFKQQLQNQLSGMQPNFGFAHYSTVLVPIPPLSEQQQIVDKIEEVLSHINKLNK